MKLFISKSTFKGVSFSFLRKQRQDEGAPSGDIKNGFIYLHHWGTGFQELIFETREAANSWWHLQVRKLQKENALKSKTENA